jgi:microcystin-dependent protein
MARQYGAKTGPFQAPTTSAARGAWFAPTEVFRQRTVNQWPVALPLDAAVAPLGSLVFATTSGVVTAATATGSFVVANGSALSRTTEIGLFNAIGESFGAGDGSTTFNIPNLYDKFIYPKGTTVSGTRPVQASGQLGALHTHSWSIKTGSFSDGATGGPPNPFTYNGVSNNSESDVQGSDIQNEQRKRALIPLVCKQTTTWPVGTVMPLLWPSYDGALFPVTNYLICSGQAVSRTTYSGLYSRLGNHYGSGDGSSTFNIPDLRGLFVSGPRQTAMVQPSGFPSSFEPDTFVAHQHRFSVGSFSQAPGNGGGPTTYARNSSPPPSTSGGLLPNESRAANISVIWAMPVV